MPPEDRPGDPHDPGWCCNEHSLIALLALCYLKVKAELVDGRAVLIDQKSKQIHTISPHWFVLVSQKNKWMGVFDSSVTFGPVKGLPVGYARRLPNVTVFLYKSMPSDSELQTLAKESQKPFVTLYEPKRVALPGIPAVRHVSSTPFGNWLTKTIGSQTGIWSKAAVVIAQTLATGKPDNVPKSFAKLTKAELWLWISRTSDADDIILDRISSVS